MGYGVPSQSLGAFKTLVKSGAFIVLDTETTGLDTGEVCQIAVIDSDGQPLIETLVKPSRPIPARATSIHGITNAMVSGAPGWREIAPRLVEIVSGRDVIAYNAVFDRKMLHRSAEYAGLPPTDWKTFSRWWCAMIAFAEVYGERSPYGGYRFQKLAAAARYYRIAEPQVHHALEDCRLTLAIVKALAET